MFPKTRTRLKPQIIVNPESNKGRTGKRWSSIRDAFKVFFKEFKFEFTEKPYQAAEISREAIKSGVELVVGVGGDGTMHEIANGFFEDRNIINPEAALGVVPSGSGSDYSRSLNIPHDLRRSLEIITHAPSRILDAGRARYLNHSGVMEERVFINIADFGIGGEVVRRVDQARSGRRASSYLKNLVNAVLSFRPRLLDIRIDGVELPLEDYMIGAVANGRIFGKGMKIAPKALLDDGLFDVVLIRGMRLREFFSNAWRLYTGSHLSHKKISLVRGKRIDVTPDQSQDGETLIEIDGEQLGRAPANFEITPRVLPVKCLL